MRISTQILKTELSEREYILSVLSENSKSKPTLMRAIKELKEDITSIENTLKCPVCNSKLGIFNHKGYLRCVSNKCNWKEKIETLVY